MKHLTLYYLTLSNLSLPERLMGLRSGSPNPNGYKYRAQNHHLENHRSLHNNNTWMSSYVEYHRFKRSETCTEEGCRARKWYIEDGRKFCQRGHAQAVRSYLPTLILPYLGAK